MKKKLLILSIMVLGASMGAVLLVQAKTAQPTKQAPMDNVATCGQAVTDRDGFVYQTMEIGGRCWLASNLRTKSKPDGTCINQPNKLSRSCPDASVTDNGKGRSCYNNLEKNCLNGGALYTWDAAMNGSHTEGAQGICPTGWHVPTTSEYYSLVFAFAKPQLTAHCSSLLYGRVECDPAGAALKVGGASGFNASLSGIRAIDGFSFGGQGTETWQWTSKEHASSQGHAYSWLGLNVDSSAVTRLWLEKENSFPMRCVRN